VSRPVHAAQVRPGHFPGPVAGARDIHRAAAFAAFAGSPEEIGVSEALAPARFLPDLQSGLDGHVKVWADDRRIVAPHGLAVGNPPVPVAQFELEFAQDGLFGEQPVDVRGVPALRLFEGRDPMGVEVFDDAQQAHAIGREFEDFANRRGLLR